MKKQITRKEAAEISLKPMPCPAWIANDARSCFNTFENREKLIKVSYSGALSLLAWELVEKVAPHAPMWAKEEAMCTVTDYLKGF